MEKDQKTPKNSAEPKSSPSAFLKTAEEKFRSLKPPANLPRWKRILAWSVIGGVLGLAVFGGVLVAYLSELPGLPTIDDIAAQSQATRIYDANGALVTQLAVENRTLVDLNRIPDNLKKAMIALEDQNFWSHWGIDVKGVIRATLINLRTGKVIQGASTITQQLAKNRFLTSERTMSRKIKEVLLAMQIERRYTKEEILSMYFNQIYFGNGAYGAEAAARTYFGKHVDELDLSECATLAGIPRSPNMNNPINNPARAKLRRDTALQSMLDIGFVAKETYDETLKMPIKVFAADPVVAAYFVEEVRQQLEKSYGSNAVYKGGLSVYTTLDLRLQDIAQRSVENGARDAEAKALPYFEHEFSLKEKPLLQVAFIAMDPKTGAVKAMVGGRDFKKYQFNRATQAMRQPGSAFKPFIYAAAIDNGFTAADTILDAPLVYKTETGDAWKPENFDKNFKGPTTLRNGLSYSRNVVTVKLLEKIGTYNAVNYAHKMGIQGHLTRDLTLALGTSEVTLMELVNGFATLSNMGVRADPWMITSVRDAEGKLLEENTPHAVEAINANTAYIVTHILRGVLDYGTASNVRSLGFSRVAAGKTGTTSDFSDAWFVGYTPDLVAGVWFGYDQRRRIGKLLTGGAIAAPVWTDFMMKATAGQADKEFPVPAGIEFVKICQDSGKLYDGRCLRWIDEAFAEGTKPAPEEGVADDVQKFYDEDLAGTQRNLSKTTKVQGPKPPADPVAIETPSGF
jgi:penicillin-binding protein 1A